MKILISPDKFKGTLSASRAAELIAGAFRETLSGTEIVEFPLADGGEGTVEALTKALKGKFRRCLVHDPLGKKIEGAYGLAGDLAVIEMAAASGMALLPKEKLDPLSASTFGTGELMKDAVLRGAKKLILGIGGSATVDAGCGMAQALGCRFYDEAGNLLPVLGGGSLHKIASFDPSAMEQLLEGISILVAADVKNPLLGPEGTVPVYAPQKGASPEMMVLLEKGLAHLSGVLHAGDLPGDGAAGGLGFGLRVFCHAERESGARLVMKLTGFYEELRTASLVVTGEGCTDSQSEEGKICCEIASACRNSGVPCILLSGGIRIPRKQLMKYFSSVFTSGIGRSSVSGILSSAEEDLFSAALSIARLLSHGSCFKP